MDNYTTKERIIQEVTSLPRMERINLIQQLIFKVIKQDSTVLVNLLKDSGVSNQKIAAALQVDPSNISKDYPREEKS